MSDSANITDSAGSSVLGASFVNNHIRPVILLVFALMAALLRVTPAEAVVVYQTGFETSEGYSTNADLVGQNGWVGFGSGGNGITTGFLQRTGQQAYVGFAPPAANDASLFVYRSINQNASQVQFSVTFAIIDSTTTNRDDFYWSVFNQHGDQLFTIDLDNEELRVYYYLDDNKDRTWSGLFFTNTTPNQLFISMNFASNLWSGTFNGASVATNKPITTVGASLNLGDIDAAWAVYDPAKPGNNFMVFDDYRISATVAPPQLMVLALTNGVPALRVTGETNNRFAVEASTDLTSWLPLKTNVTTGGSFDYIDSSSVGLPNRLYRARWVP
jgi:hypothetical protein